MKGKILVCGGAGYIGGLTCDSLLREGFDVVVSLVSPYRGQREELKTALDENIIEFYVHTSEPRERDHFRVENYEAPVENFIDIDTTEDTPEQSFEKVLSVIHG